MCRSKHVQQLRNIGIINYTTRSHLVGYFYKIYIMMYGSMNIKFLCSVVVECSNVLEEGTVSICRVNESGSGGRCSANKKECVCYMGRLDEISASNLEERVWLLASQ